MLLEVHREMKGNQVSGFCFYILSSIVPCLVV